MNEYPETRDSLLAQVRDPSTQKAWDQFVQIYRPVIFRTALARGFQEADAHDLAQQILMAVAKAIGTWEKRNSSTRFRHWLGRVTKNAILNALQRCPKDQAVGSSSVDHFLQEVAQNDGETSALVELEYRRSLYLQAAERVKREFHADSWRAFEMSIAGRVSINEVARTLGKCVGAVYTARSRIMYRLKEVIAELKETDS